MFSQNGRRDHHEIARHRPAPDTHVEPSVGLTDISPIRHDDQKIEIAIRTNAPFGGRTEKNDALRSRQTDNLRHDLSNAVL